MPTDSVTKNFTHKSSEIEKIAFSEVNSDLFKRNTPYVICGALDSSAAFSAWTDEYLGHYLGDQQVHVYVSLDGSFPGGESSYDSGDYQLFEMSFSEFLERMNSNKHEPLLASGERYYLYQSPADNYTDLLKDLGLPPQIPSIEKESTEKENSQDESSQEQDCIRALWISSAGNKTPPHWDSYDNVMVQIRGRKRFLLWEPKYYEQLYIRPLGQQHDRQSPIDIASPDLEKYPQYAQAQALECILEPGEMLYIPLGWMHFVESLDFSISVSHWWLPSEISQLLTALAANTDPLDVDTTIAGNSDSEAATQPLMDLATKAIEQSCQHTRPELIDLFAAMNRDGSVLDLSKLSL